MKKKSTFLLVLIFVFSGLNSQINIEKIGKSTADAYINDGDMILSHSSDFNIKKKNDNKISEIDPSKPLFLTIALNRKVSTHKAFQLDNGKPYAWLRIQTKDGERISFQMRFNTEDAGAKYVTFQLSENPLSASNDIHTQMAEFFGKLSNGKHNLSFFLESDDAIKTTVDINCESGTGIYGALLKELDAVKKQKEDEERIAKEAEDLKRNAAISVYKSSPDVVKISFNNKGSYQGNIKVETGNSLTGQYVKLAVGKKSEAITVRPGDKIYVGNELVHTVAASSNNKVIDVKPKRPETSPDCSGSRRISVVHLENKTGRYLRYRISGDGFSGQGSIFSSGTDHITCCPYGYQLEVNVIDDQNSQENSSNYQPFITITQDHEGKTIVIE